MDTEEIAPKGSLYLIPTRLGTNPPLEVIPFSVKKVVEQVDHYIMENEKQGRRFIKEITPGKAQGDLQISLLNKFTDPVEMQDLLAPCTEGLAVGLLSDAGTPAIADPGAEVVRMAHERGIKVIPLVGPSSIIMAMMSSGLNGQNFAFVGYLPIDKMERRKAIKNLERRSKELGQSQIIIETPYRNDALFKDLRSVLTDGALLCVACDITLPTEYILTKTAKEWKEEELELHKRPTVFVIHKE